MACHVTHGQCVELADVLQEVLDDRIVGVSLTRCCNRPRGPSRISTVAFLSVSHVVRPHRHVAGATGGSGHHSTPNGSIRAPLPHVVGEHPRCEVVPDGGAVMGKSYGLLISVTNATYKHLRLLISSASRTIAPAKDVCLLTPWVTSMVV